MKVEKDNCLRLQCEANANDHWVSFPGYHFNYYNYYIIWVEKCGQANVANRIFLRKGVDPE